MPRTRLSFSFEGSQPFHKADHPSSFLKPHIQMKLKADIIGKLAVAGKFRAALGGGPLLAGI